MPWLPFTLTKLPARQKQLLGELNRDRYLNNAGYRLGLDLDLYFG